MSALLTDLEDDLIDALAPPDAPSDEDIANYHDAVANEDETLATVTRPLFRVTDLASADWAGRKIVQAQARIDEAKAYRVKVLAKLDAQVAREEARARPVIEFMEAMLTDWLRREIDADPKGAKSRSLPSGVTVKRVAGRESLVVEDEEALIGWALANEPQLLKYTPKVADIKAAVKIDGLAVPGVALTRGEDSFKLTVGGGS